MPLQLPLQPLLQPLLQPQEPEQPLLQPEQPQEPEQPLLQLPQLPLHPQEPEQPQELEQPLLQPQDEHLLQELQMLEQELLEHVIFNQNLLFSGLLHPILPAGKV